MIIFKWEITQCKKRKLYYGRDKLFLLINMMSCCGLLPRTMTEQSDDDEHVSLASSRELQNASDDCLTNGKTSC